MELSALQVIGIAILLVIGAYIVVRLIAKATFKSYFEAKGQFEQPTKELTKKEGGKSNARL